MSTQIKEAPAAGLRETVCLAMVNYPSHQARVIAKTQGFDMYYVAYEDIALKPPKHLFNDPWNVFVHVDAEHVVRKAF